MASRGGRSPGQEARHFRLLKELGNQGVVIGRIRNYVSHLAKCTHYQASQVPEASPHDLSLPTETAAATQEVNTAFTLDLSSINTPESVVVQPTNKSRARRALVLDKGSVLSSKRFESTPAKTIKNAKRQFTKQEIKEIERVIIEMHADNHLPDRLIERVIIEMHADNHLPDRLIERDSVLRFLELLVPGITDILPSRRTLGSRILKEHAARCKAIETNDLKTIQDSTNGWINILPDVWQNICKEDLLGSQLSLFGALLTYALLPAGDEHHGVAIAAQLEKRLEQNSCHSMTSNRFPVLICSRFNNLVKSVLRSSLQDLAARAATAVKKVNASSSKWLPRAREMMVMFYGRDLELRALCETRWNSRQGCFASLLRVQTALQMFYRKGLPDPPISGIGSLCKIAVCYYRDYLALLFSSANIGEIRRDILDWMKGRFTCIKASEFPGRPWQYWECVVSENPSSALPKLAIRLISIAVNPATCERLFSELGLIHTPKRNRMAASKTLDFHTLAKHVRQCEHKNAVESNNPKKKLLISSVEREIILDANASGSFSPSPPPRGSARVDEDSDNEDPGDGVEGEPTLSLWGEFLD
ncbi:unnamed protein product [Phytophthora fragariaefolia]|uniref:Unnamed protein product n=1 Tax=Phytophthora fragariaefolia TaxID=1490495 RepID=A0A9W6XKY4_9STRA|nr:unnamed protein product [Phytophthora fragariaefolia]